MAHANYQSLKLDVLNKFYVAMHQTVENNFDAKRYNTDGQDYSKTFMAEMHMVYLDHFFSNCEKIYQAYRTLEDEFSKKIYIDVLVFKLIGHLHYKIDSSDLRNAEKNKKFLEFSEQFSKPSELETNGMFGNLVHYDFEWEGKKYIIDCLQGGLHYTLSNRQYFYERGRVKVAPEAGDYVVDGGACLGDTALIFSNTVGETGHVYSFDPVEDNLKILLHNVEGFPLKNVTVYPCGLSHENIQAEPIVLNTYAPGFSSERAMQNNLMLPLRSLDFLVTCGDIEKVNFIKLDIEGAEMSTLRGAKYTINKFRPKMAISLYHKPDDFFEIINYVKENHPFYRVYFDHYTIHQEESVAYFSPMY